MTKATTIGLDIAKQVFQVHGVDKAGRGVLRRKLRRSEVVRFFSELSPCLVGIEASGSAHYWARVLRQSGAFGPADGATVRQAVREVSEERCQRCGSDLRGGDRPNMRFVPQKSVEQQDLQCLHRVRSRWSPAVRSSSTKSAVCWPSTGSFCHNIWDRCAADLPTVLEDAENQLTASAGDLFRGLYEELTQLDEKIAAADHRIQIAFQNHPNAAAYRRGRGHGAVDCHGGRCCDQQRPCLRKRPPVLSLAGTCTQAELQRWQEPGCWASASAVIHTCERC